VATTGQTEGPTSAELLAAAAALPGVTQLMALYEQHARVVAATNVYMVPTRPHVIVSVGAGAAGVGG
jgi:hypothetical protein